MASDLTHILTHWHTYAYAHTHSLSFSHTFSHPCSLTLTVLSHTHMLSCARIHAYLCPLTHIRHILTHMHIHRLIHMFTHTHSSTHKCSSTFSYSYMKTQTHTLPFLSFFHILAPTCVHSGSRINTKAKVSQRGMGGGTTERQRSENIQTAG